MMDIGMLKGILGAMGAELPTAQEPTNLVAEFVDREVAALMPDDPDIVDIFKGVYVGAANNDPNKVLGILIRVHRDIGELVRALQTERYIDDHPPEEPEEIEECQSVICAHCGRAITDGSQVYLCEEGIDGAFCNQDCADNFIIDCVGAVDLEE